MIESFIIFENTYSALHPTPSSEKSSISLRGAIIKKKGKMGKNSLMGGGGVKIKKIKSQFQFGNFENRGGGLNFSEMSELIVALRYHPKYQK